MPFIFNPFLSASWNERSMPPFVIFSLALLGTVACATSAELNETHATADRSLSLFGFERNIFKCPAYYGRYPHPDSCEYYYVCRFGWPTVTFCNRGYLYDEEKEQCRDKKKVHCHKGKDDKNKDKDKEDDEETKKFKCPYIWGTFPHPDDCSKYFVCLYNVPTAYQCHGTDLYDVKIKKCLPRKRVDCGKRFDKQGEKTTRKPIQTTTSKYGKTTPKYVKTTTSKPVTTTTAEPSTTEQNRNDYYCPFPDGFYPDPDDCSQYYECRSAVPYLHKCPQSTLYDEREELCLDAGRVGCDNRPGGSGGDLLPEEKDKTIFCPYTWGIFIHPNDCSKYIVCTYNVPTVFSCRKHELFHAFYRRCFPKELVPCGDRDNPDDLNPPGKTTVGVINPSTTTTTTTAPKPTRNTLGPTATAVTPTTVPTHVTKLNTPPPNDCAEDDLDCILDITGDVVGWFDCPKRYGHYPHGNSRQLFIHCDNWVPLVKECADKTYFSPTFLVCMWEAGETESFDNFTRK